MSGTTQLALGGVALVLAFLAAWGRRALQQFSRRELETICRRHENPQRFREILAHDDQVALGVESLQAITTVAWILLGVDWATGPGRAEQVSWGTAAGVFAAVVFTFLAVELWLPRTLARLGAAWFVFHFWNLLWLVHQLMLPLVALGRVVDVIAHRLAGRPLPQPSEDTLEEEIRTLVTRGHRDGVLEEDYREMIEGVLHLHEVDVAQIMTPRTEMFCLPVNTTVGEALQAILQHGYTRIPVYRDTRDDIIGVLYAKDLLRALGADPAQARSRPVEPLLRAPLFVPETKRVDDLLQEFQRKRTHLAIVLDEYGGVSGLVTIEDVLEEIVGEITDEYDRQPEEEIRQIDYRTVEVLAKVHVEELNQRLGIHLEENGDFDTIGGYVFSALGRVPQVGEQLQRDNVRITVLEATPRRIHRLRIEVLENGHNGS